MPSTYTTNLGIEKIATGEQSGTWGTTTNTNLDLIDQAINGIITVTATGTGTSGSPNTLPITDGSVSNGRNKFIEINDGGDLGGNVFYQLTPSDAEKILFVRNSLTSQDLILFQGTYNASNDLVVPNGKDMLVRFSGTGSGSTVTDVFNDLRATKIDPATLSINGTAVTATAAELNILDGVTSTTAELNILDGVTATTAELNYNDITTLGTSQASKVVTADSNGDIEIGGDVTFTGTSKVQQTKEKITVSATAATGTINYDALTQSVLYYTSDASANWTVNVRGDGSNTLNSIMSTGEALTVVFLVTQGSTAYYNSAFQVDGSSVTPKYQGGEAPSEGTASGIDAYTYNIIKTGDAAFTVLASLVDFS